MFEGRNKKIILAVVILLVIAAISTLIYFIVDFNKVPNNNGEASDTEREGETGGTVKKKKKTNEVSTSDTPLADLKFENNASSNQDNNNTTRQIEMYEGYPVAGRIQIPKINLDLKILADSGDKALKVSVGVEVTSAGLNKVGNTTIIGHNYRDGTLFSNNKDLVKGDKIYITDNKGTTIEYIIYNTYITKRSSSDYLVRETEGRREITLTTCTDDTNTTQNINVIWAKENI